MPKLEEINGSIFVVNDAEQIIAEFDLVSGLLKAKMPPGENGTRVPTSDPHIKGAPYLNANNLRYSKG